MSESNGSRRTRRGTHRRRSASAVLAAVGGLLAASAAVAPAAHAGTDVPFDTRFDQHCLTVNGVPTDEITVNVENLGPGQGLTSTGLVIAYSTVTPGNVVDHTDNSWLAFDASRQTATATFALPNPSAADTLKLQVTGFWSSPTTPQSAVTIPAPVVNCGTATAGNPNVFSASNWSFSTASATATCGARYVWSRTGGFRRLPWETITVQVGPDNKNMWGADFAGMPVWVDYWTDGGTVGYTQGATGTSDVNGNATLSFTATPTAGTEFDLMVNSRNTGGNTFAQHLWAPSCS
ncbi:hypothetical protein ABH931_004987 [Streptacidiphilus sp. MAP12-33]|uniref:hypothetical protein n=1 Tax=Streptacidiphilus sp. MAP12-33 TaxID=3156266 RepID=UPI003511C2CF